MLLGPGLSSRATYLMATQQNQIFRAIQSGHLHPSYGVLKTSSYGVLKTSCGKILWVLFVVDDIPHGHGDYITKICPKFACIGTKC